MKKSVYVPYKVRADKYTDREILGEIIEIRGELLTVNCLTNDGQSRHYLLVACHLVIAQRPTGRIFCARPCSRCTCLHLLVCPVIYTCYRGFCDHRLCVYLCDDWWIEKFHWRSLRRSRKLLLPVCHFTWVFKKEGCNMEQFA